MAPGEEPPVSSEPDEDWIRLPASDSDVLARAGALRARLPAISVRPAVDYDGRLFFGGRWISLSPIEAAVTRLLVDRFGAVVDGESLAGCAGQRRLSSTAIRVHISRLRKRFSELGLTVHTLRGRGYVLEQQGVGAGRMRAVDTL